MTCARSNKKLPARVKRVDRSAKAEVRTIPVAVLCVTAFWALAAAPKMNNAVRPMMPELQPQEPVAEKPVKAPDPKPTEPVTPIAEAKPAATQPTPIVIKPAQNVAAPAAIAAQPTTQPTPIAAAQPAQQTQIVMKPVQATTAPTPIAAAPATQPATPIAAVAAAPAPVAQPATQPTPIAAAAPVAPPVAQPIAAPAPIAAAPVQTIVKPASKPAESPGLQLVLPPKPIAAAQPAMPEGVGIPVTLASANLVASAPELAGKPGLVHEGDRTWLDNVPSLKWKKSGETSFLGALSAALRANPADVGKKWLDAPTREKFATPGDVDKYDFVSLMGDTGVAFRVRWFRSGPRPGNGWGYAQSAAGDSEDLGLLERRLGRKFSPEGYFWPEKPDMSEYMPRIIESIDNGRPVLAFGNNDETGVIVGYDRQAGNVMMRDYFATGNDPWVPSFQIGGYLCFIGQRTGRELSRKEAASVGLSAGVRNWARGPVGVHQLGMVWLNAAEKIHYGAGAYDEWMTDIGSFDELNPRAQAQLMAASAWNMNVLADARWAAATYLKSIANQFGENRVKLEKAAAMYAANATAMDKLIEERRAFLGPWHDKKVEDWSADMRALEIEALKQFRAQDEKAINLIREAIK